MICGHKETPGLFRMICLDLRLAVCSRQFLRACGWFFGFYLLFMTLFLSVTGNGFPDVLSEPNLSVLYLMEYSTRGLTANLLFLCVLPVLPYGSAVSDDLNGQSLSLWTVRGGLRRYAISKLLCCAAAGFLLYCVGSLLVIGLGRLFYPLAQPGSSGGTSYGDLLDSGRTALYTAVTLLHYGLTGALYAGTGMLVSVFVPNRCAVCASPVVLFFFANRIVGSVVPALAQVPTWLTDGVFEAGSWGATLGVKALAVLLLLCAMGEVLLRKLRRRCG